MNFCAVRAAMHGCFLPFADLVVIAKESYPIPFRTRPSKPSAPMVLRLKPRESRSLPGLQRTKNNLAVTMNSKSPAVERRGAFCLPTYPPKHKRRDRKTAAFFVVRIVVPIFRRRRQGA